MVYELSQGKEGQKYRDGLKVQPRLSFAVVCVCVCYSYKRRLQTIAWAYPTVCKLLSVDWCSSTSAHVSELSDKISVAADGLVLIMIQYLHMMVDVCSGLPWKWMSMRSRSVIATGALSIRLATPIEGVEPSHV